ncbi:MAG: M20/M25/M40 family metallo-hydrolase [Chloroflexi bacterium]|nr:M20/M25/M40 family metallo-hydrolase [Chloroflexota bacterium]
MSNHNRYGALLNDLAQRWQGIYSQLDQERILQQAIAIQQIPAPTFSEENRAKYVEHRFGEIGLGHVQRDEMNNVYGWLGSPDSRQVILVSAHLDTVFPIETRLDIRQDGHRVYGPGLGDNSLGVAGLLILAEIFCKQIQPPNTTICFVANTREEGLGNLDGIRAVRDTLTPQRIIAAVVLEGIALGRVYHAGIAVKRLKITTQAEGGHSWFNFGRPSAIHQIVRLAADITQLTVPTTPKTTYNIGMIEGGQSVNSIAAEASLYLDLRSTTAASLAELEKQVHSLLERHQTLVPVHVEIVGNRPAGMIPANHKLVRIAQAVLGAIGRTGMLETGSTDANVLLAASIPAVVVGISQGGNAHRTDEFIDTQLVTEGIWQLILLLAAVATEFGHH